MLPFMCDSGIRTSLRHRIFIISETLCEKNFITGAVAVACGNKVGDSCENITCNYGFHEAENVDQYNCTEDGSWNYNLTSLCTGTFFYLLFIKTEDLILLYKVYDMLIHR